MSLWCALDESDSANGTLFMDDGESIGNMTSLITYNFLIIRTRVSWTLMTPYKTACIHYVSSGSISSGHYLELKFSLNKVRKIELIRDSQARRETSLLISRCFIKGTQLDITVLHNGYTPPGGLRFTSVEISGLSGFPSVLYVNGKRENASRFRLKRNVSKRKISEGLNYHSIFRGIYLSTRVNCICILAPLHVVCEVQLRE